MGRPTLAAALIVKDEQDNLPACLDSLREVVDEIVIYDTGSTDDTVGIAERVVPGSCGGTGTVTSPGPATRPWR
jgi:hypothetical protein